MSVLHRPRTGTLVLVMAFAVATSSSALARQNAKRTQPIAPPPGVMMPSPAPARYFTINQVLAKREDQRVLSPGMLLASTSATTTDEPPAGRQASPSGEPFGLSTFRAPDGLLWVKWRTVERQLHDEAGQIELCQTGRSACAPHALHFLRLVEFAQARTGRARIEMVNRAVNSAIRYTSDQVQHGVPDLWTAPLATLASGRGDCEDYAIAKYAILRASGVPAQDLRLLLVRDRSVSQDHAVLAVRDNGRWVVLDNRHSMLAETTMLPHFVPLFVLDHNGVSLFASPYARPAPEVQPAGLAPPALAPKVLAPMVSAPMVSAPMTSAPMAKQGEPHGDTLADGREASLPAATL